MEKLINEKSKEYKTWSKEVTSDKVTRRIEVKEVENGYVITKTLCGDDAEGNYNHQEKIYINEENPLEPSKSLFDSALEAIDNIG